MTVLEHLRAAGVEIASDCGGNGTCGTCLVEITDENGKKSLHKACKITYKKGMSIRIVDKRPEMSIVGLTDAGNGPEKGTKNECYPCDKADKYGISIDIGTTTLAGVLTVLDSGCPQKVISSETAVNSQKIYGSDIISRIRAAQEGAAEELTRLLRRDTAGIISRLITDARVDNIAGVSIAGNATIVHSLMGYDISGLGRYPYETVVIDTITTTIGDIFEGLEGLNNILVYIMPGTGAFIGGDIISGLFACGLPVENETDIFIDLGTNGEIAVSDGGVIFTSSTAAGPVFEGGCVKYGVPSTSGAICGVKLNNTFEVTLETINKLPPTGLCGTGVIEMTAELLENELIARDGFMEEDFLVTSDPAKIFFTREDVRQVQLAKAAIRAGIDILLKKTGRYYKDVSKVYLAGGFGCHIDPVKAAVIGMIPAELVTKTVAPGNTSLAGAVRFLEGNLNDNMKEIEKIRNNCRYVDLAAEKGFEERYIKELNF
ncbi:MAG: ASKHA domain-containing protein [Lachnospiraceae bacterium]|nr:ASKHA domain-containing protein [Lachnospiraceae bacterium]